MISKYTRIRKSDRFKYVYLFKIQRNRTPDVEKWAARISKTLIGVNFHKVCESEKHAAMAVDLKLIEHGKMPVNILKPKSS